MEEAFLNKNNMGKVNVSRIFIKPSNPTPGHSLQILILISGSITKVWNVKKK
jgi:hypothetical protein